MGLTDQFRWQLGHRGSQEVGEGRHQPAEKGSVAVSRVNSTGAEGEGHTSDQDSPLLPLLSLELSASEKGPGLEVIPFPPLSLSTPNPQPHKQQAALTRLGLSSPPHSPLLFSYLLVCSPSPPSQLRLSSAPLLLSSFSLLASPLLPLLPLNQPPLLLPWALFGPLALQSPFFCTGRQLLESLAKSPMDLLSTYLAPNV